MTENQSLNSLSARVIEGFDDLLRRHRPQLLIVQGDTTSAVMSALAAFHDDIPVAHVEAGLRSRHLRNPFPEELNRKIIACLAQINFAPTENAKSNLLAEGIPPESIHVVGNTVIDALLHAQSLQLPCPAAKSEVEDIIGSGRKILLVTVHRRESIGPDLVAICEGIREIAGLFADRIAVVIPVHKNPKVRLEVERWLASIPNVRLIEPLSYIHFVYLMRHARIIVTDSGGIQEEAAFLGIPVVVVRRKTERPEGIDSGSSQLIGCDPKALVGAVSTLLTDESVYRSRAVPSLVFGDGHTAERIVSTLLRVYE